MGSGSSGLSASGGGSLSISSGKNDPEVTDDIHDFFLPDSVRSMLPEIEKLRTYSDLERYFADRGIVLDTDLDALKTTRKDDDLPAVADLGQKLAVGIETYRSVFGNDSLKNLKKINLYDNSLDVPAAYHFNLVGENDPLAGTIRFRDWNASGRDVFHELGHAFQDSNKRSGEDVISFSNRVAKSVKIPNSAYKGTSGLGEQNAEMMAEAFGFGFGRGSKNGLSFIQEMHKKKWR